MPLSKALSPQCPVMPRGQQEETTQLQLWMFLTVSEGAAES